MSHLLSAAEHCVDMQFRASLMANLTVKHTAIRSVVNTAALILITHSMWHRLLARFSLNCTNANLPSLGYNLELWCCCDFGSRRSEWLSHRKTNGAVQKVIHTDEWHYTFAALGAHMAVWCSGNALVSINAVALHRARLVLGWVTAFGQVNCLIT